MRTSKAVNFCVDSRVTIALHGETGDTGIRSIHSSSTQEDKNLPNGSLDSFVVEAVHLGKLRSIVLDRDGISDGMDDVMLVQQIITMV